jgi:hypothetical protein
MLDELREYCMGLGGVESVRAHRIVYGRGMSYRWFADMEPADDHIILKTQRGWRHPPHCILVPYGGNTSGARDMIRAAYDAV